MNKTMTASLSAAMLLAATAGHAATVDFSQNGSVALNDGDLIESFDFGSGLTGSISVVGGTNEGRVLASEEGGVGVGEDPDLESPFSDSAGNLPGMSFGNVLIIQSNDNNVAIPNDEASGGTISFSFDTAINLENFFFLDGEEGFTVTSGGATLGSVASGTASDNEFSFLDLSDGDFGPITSFEVAFGGSGAIGQFDASVAAVPLPASLPLLFVGAGSLVALRRRRKKA